MKELFYWNHIEMHVVNELIVVLNARGVLRRGVAVLRSTPQSYSNWHIKNKIIGIYRRL